MRAVIVLAAALGLSACVHMNAVDFAKAIALLKAGRPLPAKEP